MKPRLRGIIGSFFSAGWRPGASGLGRGPEPIFREAGVGDDDPDSKTLNSSLAGGQRIANHEGGNEMIVLFSARYLKPGAWEQYRRAWDPGDARPPGLQRIFHARNIRDEDEIISFGIFDMTEDDYHRWRSENDAAELKRVDNLSAFVEHEPVSGVYEVIDELDG
jgi:hypothetical protein